MAPPAVPAAGPPCRVVIGGIPYVVISPCGAAQGRAAAGASDAPLPSVEEPTAAEVPAIAAPAEELPPADAIPFADVPSVAAPAGVNSENLPVAPVVPPGVDAEPMMAPPAVPA